MNRLDDAARVTRPAEPPCIKLPDDENFLYDFKTALADYVTVDREGRLRHHKLVVDVEDCPATPHIISGQTEYEDDKGVPLFAQWTATLNVCDQKDRRFIAEYVLREGRDD